MKVAMICDVMGQPNNGTTLAALNLIRYLSNFRYHEYVEQTEET